MLPSVPPQMSVCSSTCPSPRPGYFNLGLILVCHCSYRGVVELLRDLFDQLCGTIGYSQLLTKPLRLILPRLVCNPSGTAGRNIPGSQPVLVGSMPSQLTALLAAEHRDEDTWGCIYWMLASKVYPLTTPLLTLRKDSELGKQQLVKTPVMEIHPASRQRIG